MQKKIIIFFFTLLSIIQLYCTDKHFTNTIEKDYQLDTLSNETYNIMFQKLQ